jgi:hypothetical protein
MEVEFSCDCGHDISEFTRGGCNKERANRVFELRCCVDAHVDEYSDG